MNIQNYYIQNYLPQRKTFLQIKKNHNKKNEKSYQKYKLDLKNGIEKLEKDLKQYKTIFKELYNLDN